MNKIRQQLYFRSFRVALFLVGIVSITMVQGQKHHERLSFIDIIHYKFNIELNDSSNKIQCAADIKIYFKKNLDSFILDLHSLNADMKGMVVDSILRDSVRVNYVHVANELRISDSFIQKGKELEYQVYYHGIPENGLIITENLFGNRVFFADNWPNRAHFWLPTVDHPSDKATVEFIVKAPSHYQVVSNGQKIEETNADGYIITHWKENVPLPTKVMVIGVGQFATQHYLGPDNISMSTWVYPENRENGFYDYQLAIKPFEYFHSVIGPYPYYKLANVQAKTMFGGMENAGCIFYSEKTVTGKQDYMLLFAHEAAHQWFGNSVTEKNWHHIWLSEGFATYLTGLYVENEYGEEAFGNWLDYTRNGLITSAEEHYFPIIDTSLSVSLDLLNDNTYDKAAFFLHMLRNEIGDDVFWDVIQTFYRRFKNSNALTNDFLLIVNELSGRDLDAFFYQWLYKKGHPKLKTDWKYNNAKLELGIEQMQESEFTFPLEIEIIFPDDSGDRKIIQVEHDEGLYILECPRKPIDIVVDPDRNLLFELLK